MLTGHAVIVGDRLTEKSTALSGRRIVTSPHTKLYFFAVDLLPLNGDPPTFGSQQSASLFHLLSLWN